MSPYQPSPHHDPVLRCEIHSVALLDAVGVEEFFKLLECAVDLGKCGGVTVHSEYILLFVVGE